jgi:gamma-glutamyltranspeptidase/glutathione hydrolase
MRRLVWVWWLALALPVWAAQPVHARHAMVVTVEQHATDAGVAVLEAGGNAVDAAVAVGFALAVTHPSAGNIGGGGFMLVRFADGRSTFLDFRERAPEKASRNMYLDASGKATNESVTGYRAAGVPGSVRGFEHASKKYGRKPWADVVGPAVALAEKGFPVSYGLAKSLGGSAGRLGQFPESKRIFLRDGKLYEAGETFVQPEMARTLRRIREQGARDFYEGETARLLAADMERHGGLVTLADLKDYAVVERTAAHRNLSRLRHYHIAAAQLRRTRHPADAGRAGRLGIRKGRSGVGRRTALPGGNHAPLFRRSGRLHGRSGLREGAAGRLLDPAYIAQLRKSIDPEHATPSSQLHAGKPPGPESSETTHYSIVDADGNAVAVTYTLNFGYGDGVTVPGLGFLLNDEMDDFAAKPGEPNGFGLVQGEANAIQPRKRPLSSMTPTIVTRGGKLELVLGTPGGPTIINSVLEVLVNVVDFGMNVQDAVDYPRIHHQWLPDQLVMERGFSPDTIALLKARGHQVRMVGGMGEVAAIQARDGWLEGAADPRTEGTAKGY